MSTASLSEPGREFKIVEDATCTFCGCVCDDITLKVEGDRITEANTACVLGDSWFLSQQQSERAACLIDGQPAAVEAGIERAARILTEAKYPIVCGLSHTTSEAQRVAVSIADWIGGCVDTTTGECRGAWGVAFGDVGQVTCTLGEIKNRGDLVIVWGADPAESHPRHFTRYSLMPKGTFVPRGRPDRYCVVVDVQKTKSAEGADQFIPIKPHKDFEALWALRALAKGVELDAAEIEVETGVSRATWQALMDRMKKAKYGVILFDIDRMSARAQHLNCHAILTLTRDMNAHARFVCLALGAAGNATGADNVVTWRTGYPFAVNLGRGYPRFNPGEYTTAEVLGRGEADAALIVASDPMSGLSEAARSHLAGIPSIVLDPRDTPTTRAATVVFHTATYGINTAGTVYRIDGVPIPLRPALDSSRPSDEEVLRRIDRRTKDLGAPTSWGE